MSPAEPPPEFQRLLAIDRIGPGGLDDTVRADAAECAALALRLGVPALPSLECAFRLTAGPAGFVHAVGRLRARVDRICVVTLDAFETAVDEAFSLDFVPAGHESEEIDPESDDEVPYEGGAIDLGEAAAEQLALVLDPYPRKPGVTLPEDDAAQADSPFAALSRLKRGE